MRATRALVALLPVALLASLCSPATAQLEGPFGSSSKGRIYGLEVASRPDVVFLIDVSGRSHPAAAPVQPGAIRLASDVELMAAGPNGVVFRQGPGRRQDEDALERARKQVAHAIEGLSDGQRFGLVVIAAGLHEWRSALVPATRELRKDAARFVEGVAPQGNAPWAILTGGKVGLREGLEAAFAMAPRTLVVVAGGAPAKGTAAALLDRVSELNAGSSSVIYSACVGECEDPADEAFVRDLAERNGGTPLTGRGTGDQARAE